MKRVISSLRRLFVSSKFKKFLIVLLIFSLGLCGGLLIAGFTQGDSNSSQSQSTGSRALTQEERNQRNLEQLEEGYGRAKERTKRDIEAKRLTQEQADKILAKLDEIYNYRKENPDTSSDQERDELRNKRQEWREWLEQNDVSSRYFIGVI